MPQPGRDYSLVGAETARAVERGLAGAHWYLPPVDKDAMRRLLGRRDWPPMRDCIVWFGLLAASGVLALRLWQAGSLWAIVPFMVYGTLYASSSDSRWHEASHGTAFRTDWLNDVLYEIASFMVMRESTVWRWSHARHHSDTYIVGRDPEIAIPRPPRLAGVVASFFKLQVIPAYFWHVLLHCCGRMTPEEQTFVPQSEYRKVYVRAWIYLAAYAAVIGLALYQRSVLPLLFVGLPTVYGSWLQEVYSIPQHAGLAEDVLDHRLNSRTIYLDPVNRFLYWNMNYHVEHHLFPLVPYYNLASLHQLVRADLPVPYRGLWDAWREIVPTLLRQVHDAAYFVRRPLPEPASQGRARRTVQRFTAQAAGSDGWSDVCGAGDLRPDDVVRCDSGGRTYAIYRMADGALHATDGLCTHGGVHLAGGLVKGRLIECPKHNGRFDFTDGSAQRLPACVALMTYPVRQVNGRIQLFCKRLQS